MKQERWPQRGAKDTRKATGPDNCRTRRSASRQKSSALQKPVLLPLFAAIEIGIVQKTRRYIGKNIHGPLSLDELAAAAETSKYHFIRKYKELSGRTPMEDVRHMRVDHARELILTTSLPLKAIPERVGIENAYHMSRLFRQCLGITPGSLRRKAR